MNNSSIKSVSSSLNSDGSKILSKDKLKYYYCKTCNISYEGTSDDPQTKLFRRTHSKGRTHIRPKPPKSPVIKKKHPVLVDEKNQFTFHKCRYCSFKCSSYQRMLSHERYIHGPQMKKFTCRRCHKSNMNQAQYKTHCCSEEDLELRKALAKEAEKNAEILLCQFCGYTTRKQTGLKFHIKTYHTERNFQCNICDRKFITLPGLQKHITYHENPRPRVGNLFCHDCGRTFKEKSSLRIHILTVHMGMKLAKCSICDKPFAKRESLRQHLLTHTGKRPYTCDICGKTFVQKPALTGHRKNHPGELPPMPVVYIDSYIREVDPSMVHEQIVPVPKFKTETLSFQDFKLQV